MKVKAIKTQKVLPNDIELYSLLDKNLKSFKENQILAITSKVVSLCEGRVQPLSRDTEELNSEESSLFLPKEISKYGHHFSITNDTLIAFGGIDESNSGGDYYVLWPKDPEKTSNEVRKYLKQRFSLKHVGVIITDSTSMPLRLGTRGISIAFSGFNPLKDYIGQPDLFGRPFHFSKSNIAEGIASAAVLVMGEGTEQTPLAVVSDIPFVEFVDRNPTFEELSSMHIKIENDLFAPFLQRAPWKRGKK